MEVLQSIEKNPSLDPNYKLHKVQPTHRPIFNHTTIGEKFESFPFAFSGGAGGAE